MPFALHGPALIQYKVGALTGKIDGGYRFNDSRSVEAAFIANGRIEGPFSPGMDVQPASR